MVLGRVVVEILEILQFSRSVDYGASYTFAYTYLMILGVK